MIDWHRPEQERKVPMMEKGSDLSRPWDGGKVAIDVLVHWALSDQRAGDVFAGLFAIEAEAITGEPRGVSGDGCAAVERIAALGCQVDGGSRGKDYTDPVADLVATLVMQLPHDQRALVSDSGRSGEAPGGVLPPARWLAPIRWEESEREAVSTYVQAKMGHHCPLVRVSSPATMEENRRLYHRWWDALQVLAFNLSCRPLPFVVTDPAAARAPWGEGIDSRAVALA
jgi:hypothetical protein